MISYQKKILNNGLTIIVHEDKSTPLVCVNTLYKTGAKDEYPEKTGMAHLFEHLMFTGSENAPDFDRTLEYAGGENNAFTNNDITNYYDILPAENIETALWLEADRMSNLNLNQKSIDIQKSVVIEEFKETHLNQPYGDMDALMRETAFKKHPYRWSTIGLETSHIANTKKQNLIDFYKKHYSPGNAIIAIAGNIKPETSFELANKYFGNIPKTANTKKEIITEPEQLSKRERKIYADVPRDSIMMGFRMSDRLSSDFYKSDLISDVLSNGKSSRFYTKLVREKSLFSDIDAYIWGSIDPGLLVIRGFPAESINLETAEEEIWKILNELKNNSPDNNELNKVKNKAISSWMFSNINIENKAFNLSYFEMLGDVGLINKEDQNYYEVTPAQLKRNIHKVIREENCSVLKYYAKSEE